MFGNHNVTSGAGFSFNIASGPLALWCESLTQTFLHHRGQEAAKLLDPDEVLKQVQPTNILVIKQVNCQSV